DVDAEGGVHFRQRLRGNSFRQQVVEDHFDLPPAADEADVASAAVDEVEEGLFVVVVAAGDDQAVCVGRDFQARQNLVDAAGDAPLGFGEALLGHVLLPVIH